MFIDLLNRNTIIGSATQRLSGVFYISDSQDGVSVDTFDYENTVRAVMTTVCSVIDLDTNLVSSDDGSLGESTNSGGVFPQMYTVDMTDQSELASKDSTGSDNTVSSGASKLHSSDG